MKISIVAIIIPTEMTEIFMLGGCWYWDLLSFKTIKKLNFTDSHQCLKSLTQKHFEGHTQELIARNYINTPSNLTFNFIIP